MKAVAGRAPTSTGHRDIDTHTHTHTQVHTNKVITISPLNSLPNDKNLNWSKLKAFADDVIGVNEMMISLLDRIENIVGKGKNAYQHFLLFPTLFSNAFFFRVVKSQIL